MDPIPLLGEDSTNAWRKLNTLIVDDEPSILEQLQQDLIFHGFSLITAKSAEEGLEILHEQEVHVIVCDQKMPGGMCGTRFLSKVRKEWPNIVGMILSGFSEPKYLLDAVNKAKAFYYILKPWNSEELVSCLEGALKRSYLNFQNNNEIKDEEHRELTFTRRMLTEAVIDLDKTQVALKEASHALKTISEVSNKFYQRTNHPLKEHFVKHK